MSNGRDIEQVMMEIKYGRPSFVKEDFLEMVSKKIMAIYNSLRENRFEIVKNFCTDSMTEKLKHHSADIFTIQSEIDFIAIQGKRIRDYRRINSFEQIDVEMDIYYIDYMNNNKEDYHPTHRKYMEQLYKITFQSNLYDDNLKNNRYMCEGCGATMKKRPGLKMYVCEYCGNMKTVEYDDWKINEIVKM